MGVTAVIQLAALLVATFVAGWGVYTWLVKRREGTLLQVFVVDEEGGPVLATLLGPGGACVTTDPRGLASLPRSWVGREVSVRDPRDWHELTQSCIGGEKEVTRIIVAKRDSSVR